MFLLRSSDRSAGVTTDSAVEDAETWGELFRLASHLRSELQRALDTKALVVAELGMLKATIAEARRRCQVDGCPCPSHGIRI